MSAPIVHLPATTLEVIVTMVDDAVGHRFPEEQAALDVARAAMRAAGHITAVERFLAARSVATSQAEAAS